ncbi:MAG: TolC family protein [Nitrospina sp.]|nr:MAG: TolC family protein [Nitrospina sp.]
MLSKVYCLKFKNISSAFPFGIILLMIFISTSLPVSSETAVLKILPSLEEAIRLARSHQLHNSRCSDGNRNFFTEAQLIYQVKENYYGIQVKYEQLKISEEVREHFEKAVTGAEEKYESDDGEVTQSAITKLKLGLSGTLNDLVQFGNDKKLFQLRLGRLMGRAIHNEVEIGERSLKLLEFPFKTVAEYLAAQKSSARDYFELQEAMIEINKTRAKVGLAVDNRKMTRALLVTEAANYDFGIGDEGDLFEALIIYTHVLVGHFEALYNFNLSVSAFERIHAGGAPLCRAKE